MSKSILVIDTPKNCEDCPFYENEYGYYCAGIVKNCPLKPIPEKRKYLDYDIYAGSGFDRGYNACIDEILREEEWKQY